MLTLKDLCSLVSEFCDVSAAKDIFKLENELKILNPSGHSYRTAKYEILQFYPNGHSFFYSEMQNFENCTQTTISFSQRNMKFRIVPKLPFVLWLQNAKYLTLLRNAHLLFDNNLKNVMLHPNWHSFFDHEIQNLKSYSNGHSTFYYKQQK